MQQVEVLTVEILEEDKDYTLTKFSVMGVEKGYGMEDEDRDFNKDGVVDNTEKKWGENRVARNIYNLEFTYSPKFSPLYYRDDEGNILWYEKRTTEALKKRYHTQHEMIHISPIAYFDRVLVHWGSTDLDTAACYIVGTTPGYLWRGGKKRRAVLSSRAKYEEVYPLIWNAIKDALANKLKPQARFANK